MMKAFHFLQLPCLTFIRQRTMSTTVDKMLLSNLRKKTGFSFINCRNALEKFQNDVKQAESWLLEEAQKEGWVKATKLQSRSMSQGLIAVLSNNLAATMIEVNCETDFVAKNKKFIDLTIQLVQECHQSFLQQPSSMMIVDKALIGAFTTSNGKSLADVVALQVGNIGENMALRRAVHLKGGNSSIASYVHTSGPETQSDSEIRMGKYGVLMSLYQECQARLTEPSGEDNHVLSLDDISHLLGQHIVGTNPKVIGNLENDKPSEKEEEDKLLFQEFLLDPSISVGDLLKENGVTVDSFVRFACGEDLPQDEAN